MATVVSFDAGELESKVKAMYRDVAEKPHGRQPPARAGSFLGALRTLALAITLTGVGDRTDLSPALRNQPG